MLQGTRYDVRAGELVRVVGRAGSDRPPARVRRRSPGARVDGGPRQRGAGDEGTRARTIPLSEFGLMTMEPFADHHGRAERNRPRRPRQNRPAPVKVSPSRTLKSIQLSG